MEALGERQRLGVVFAADVASAIVAIVRVARNQSGGSLSARGGQSADEGQSGGSLSVRGGQSADEGRLRELLSRPLHVCSGETPSWTELVSKCAERLRAAGLEVPPPRFESARDTQFVSVDVGPLDNATVIHRKKNPFFPL